MVSSLYSPLLGQIYASFYHKLVSIKSFLQASFRVQVHHRFSTDSEQEFTLVSAVNQVSLHRCTFENYSCLTYETNTRFTSLYNSFSILGQLELILLIDSVMLFIISTLVRKVDMYQSNKYFLMMLAYSYLTGSYLFNVSILRLVLCSGECVDTFTKALHYYLEMLQQRCW